MSWNLYVHTSECMGWVHVPSFSVLKETLCLGRRDPYSHCCRRGPEGDTTCNDVTERHGRWGLNHWWSPVCGRLWTAHGRQYRSLHSETFGWLIILLKNIFYQTNCIILPHAMQHLHIHLLTIPNAWRLFFFKLFQNLHVIKLKLIEATASSEINSKTVLLETQIKYYSYSFEGSKHITKCENNRPVSKKKTPTTSSQAKNFFIFIFLIMSAKVNLNRGNLISLHLRCHIICSTGSRQRGRKRLKKKKERKKKTHLASSFRLLCCKSSKHDEWHCVGWVTRHSVNTL